MHTDHHCRQRAASISQGLNLLTAEEVEKSKYCGANKKQEAKYDVV
jgi:hypothetical protein